MRAAGVSPRVDDPDFVRRTRVMPFVHDATGMPLDVVLAGSGLEDTFLDRAQPLEIGGTSIPIIEISDLMIATVLADRPKDLEEAAALWRLHKDTLDLERIRTTLRLLEDALSQSDLLPALGRIVRPDA
jgi:hypothetical protein